MKISSNTIFTVKLEEWEYKKLALDIDYFLSHMSCSNKNPYEWNQDYIADCNLRDSEDTIANFSTQLKKFNEKS